MPHAVTTECEQAPESALPHGYTLVMAGPVMPGDECGYAHRILIGMSDTEFATWDAAYPDEAASPYCYSGHYFHSIVEAAADYAVRVARGY